MRIAARYAATGSVAPKGKRTRQSKLEPHRDYLLRRIAQAPDITIARPGGGACRAGHANRSLQPVALVHRQRLSVQKTALASEQDRVDVRRARQAWRGRQRTMQLRPHRLVFLDETGTTTRITRLYGRSPKGQRLRAKAPFGHWKTRPFIAGLRCDALAAPFVVDAPMNRRIFETHVETQLAPALHKGDVVILDNLSAHKSPRAEAAVKARGAWICSCRPTALNPKARYEPRPVDIT